MRRLRTGKWGPAGGVPGGYSLSSAPAAAPQRPPEGGGVHPLGHAADHQGPLPGQIQPQPAGGHDSIGAGLAGPHQGHGGLLVHLGQPSPAIEHAGGAVQLAQPLGIGRVLAGENPDAQGLALGQNLVGLGQVLVLQGLPDLLREARTGLKLLPPGKVGPLRGAKMMQNPGSVHPRGRSPGAQPNPVA